MRLRNVARSLRERKKLAKNNASSQGEICLRSEQSTLERRGVVLLAVLVVLVLLSLAAYQYTDLMMAEYQASHNVHRVAKVKALAESGVHYAAALLSSPAHWENTFGDNPFDNPDVFRSREIKSDDGKVIGYFSLIAPLDPDDSDGASEFRSGVADETGKININAVMKKDPTGETLFNMLKKLPNMQDDIAACIVDYIDQDKEVYGEGLGAEDDYYSGQTPSYRAKNGALDSLDELLLVKGVTEELLYGSDRNRNGVQDPGEGTSGFDRGWSAFLTVHSREQALNQDGLRMPWINSENLQELVTKLTDAGVDDDLVTFIALYRQYGPASKSGGTQSIGSTLKKLFGGKQASTPQQTVPGNLAEVEINYDKLPSRKINSLFDLVDASVSMPDPTDSKKPRILYTSPLSDKASRGELLGKLFENVSIFEELDIPARINVNTAPRDVLMSLPDLTETEVESIVTLRPRYSGAERPDPSFRTPVWLLTDAELKIETLQAIEKLVTTRSQVFKVQVLAHLEDGKGPAARVDAVIDTNGGRPRILAYRDLSNLGRTAIVPK